jgi:hypothetical protein
MTTLLSFPQRGAHVPSDAGLSREAMRDLRLVRWWRSRTIEMLHQVGADVAHMAAIRCMADELERGIIESDHESDH